jgi:hypothetical protein
MNTGEWYAYLKGYGHSKLKDSNYLNVATCNAPTQITSTDHQNTWTEEHLKTVRWPIYIEGTHEVQAFTQEHIKMYDCGFLHWSVQWHYRSKLEYESMFKFSHSNIQPAIMWNSHPISRHTNTLTSINHLTFNTTSLPWLRQLVTSRSWGNYGGQSG